MLRLICYSVVLFLFACGNASDERTDGYSKRAQAPEDSLFDEVMHGHDTAMAKMGKLGGYRKQVEQKLDSLEKAGSKATASLKNRLQELREDLKSAEDGMNQWMEDFEIDSAQNNIERRIEYLKSEKIKVDEVKEKILETLRKADSMLRKPKADSAVKK
jgi:hypothetical protein